MTLFAFPPAADDIRSKLISGLKVSEGPMQLPACCPRDLQSVGRSAGPLADESLSVLPNDPF